MTKWGLAVLSFTGIAQQASAQTAEDTPWHPTHVTTDNHHHQSHSSQEHDDQQDRTEKKVVHAPNATLIPITESAEEIAAMEAELMQGRFEADELIAAFSMPDTPEGWQKLAAENPIYNKENGLALAFPEGEGENYLVMDAMLQDPALQDSAEFVMLPDPDFPDNVVIMPMQLFEDQRKALIVTYHNNGLNYRPEIILSDTMRNNMSIDPAMNRLYVELGGLLPTLAVDDREVVKTVRDAINMTKHEAGHGVDFHQEGNVDKFMARPSDVREEKADSLGNVGYYDYVGDIQVNIKDIILNGGRDTLTTSHGTSMDRVRDAIVIFAQENDGMPQELREEVYQELADANDWLHRETEITEDLVDFYHQTFAELHHTVALEEQIVAQNKDNKTLPSGQPIPAQAQSAVDEAISQLTSATQNPTDMAEGIDVVSTRRNTEIKR